MSDKGPLNDHQTIIKSEEIMEGEKPAVVKEVRLCSICKAKPTISDSCPYCASCMAKKGSEKRRQNAVVGLEKTKAKKRGKGKTQKENGPKGEDLKVVVDFVDHPKILEAIMNHAKDQIRPLDMHIIYILKSYLEGGSPWPEQSRATGS